MSSNNIKELEKMFFFNPTFSFFSQLNHMNLCLNNYNLFLSDDKIKKEANDLIIKHNIAIYELANIIINSSWTTPDDIPKYLIKAYLNWWSLSYVASKKNTYIDMLDANLVLIEHKMLSTSWNNSDIKQESIPYLWNDLLETI